MQADIFYQQAGGEQVPASNYVDPDTGYFIANISDPSALNYAGKLTINIRYKGVTKSYLRVYIGDMWLVNGSSINNGYRLHHHPLLAGQPYL